LRAAEFLYETRLFPDLVYTFKHALTHEVAYGSLLQEQRRTLHTRLVTAIEALAGDRVTDHVERLAHHALRGELWEKALLYYQQAGARAVGRAANREGVTCFEQALIALQHLPESAETYEQAIDLRLGLRNAFSALGEHKQIFGHLQEAEMLANALGDQRRLGQVTAYMAHYFVISHDLDRAIASAERALTIAATLGDIPLQVETHFYLGEVYGSLGDLRRAIDILQKNVESITDDLLRRR
jgi:tetratricopeptide (TPR) repeat protein